MLSRLYRADASLGTSLSGLDKIARASHRSISDKFYTDQFIRAQKLAKDAKGVVHINSKDAVCGSGSVPLKRRKKAA